MPITLQFDGWPSELATYYQEQVRQFERDYSSTDAKRQLRQLEFTFDCGVVRIRVIFEEAAQVKHRVLEDPWHRYPHRKGDGWQWNWQRNQFQPAFGTRLVMLCNPPANLPAARLRTHTWGTPRKRKYTRE